MTTQTDRLQHVRIVACPWDTLSTFGRFITTFTPEIRLSDIIQLPVFRLNERPC